ncbi:MAG: 5-formyltetrahydrofolate cyclo-ligase [Clostridia bacterium]|nr:5-formyltetrahydrofolate cyclo-ligase [Clostridia bacterium]
MNVKEHKVALRRSILEKARGFTAEYITASDRQITDNILSMPLFADARSIFVYVSRGPEPDTLAVIDAAIGAGKRVYVPYITGQGRMLPKLVESRSQLKPGAYGILTALEDAQTAEISEIDLALIPCVSASLSGFRLGYGGGYYDRFFAPLKGRKRRFLANGNGDNTRNCTCLIVCRSELMSETLPTEPHDVRFDGIVNEKGVFFV